MMLSKIIKVDDVNKMEHPMRTKVRFIRIEISPIHSNQTKISRNFHLLNPCIMLKQLFTLFLGFVISYCSLAQEWGDPLADPTKNFYAIQKDFNNYWSAKTIEKGKGYKAFRRWEDYMKPRVYPSGDITLPSLTYTNYSAWEKLNTGTNEKSATGNWSFKGPTGKPTNGGAGRVNFIRFHPTSTTTFFVGTPDGGLWKTTNGGTSWTTTTDKLSIIGCSDLAIDPTNPNTMYLATGDSDGSDTYSIGVLKSTDGGNTWNTTGLTWTVSQGRSISRLLINPSNPQILIAVGSGGIFRTINGGTTWTTEISNVKFKDVEFKPGDPNTVYACGTIFRKSVDGGDTWTSVTLPISSSSLTRLSLAVSAASPNNVYLLGAKASDYGFAGFMKSTDSGTTFATSMAATSSNNILGFYDGTDAGGQGWYDLSLAVSPTNGNEVFTGGVNIWKSTNGASAFSINSDWTENSNLPYVHADIHDLQYTSSTTLYAACDGGVFKSTNNGSSWTDISSNLAIAQQYRIGLSASSANILVAGHQDNGSNYMSNTTWKRWYGGDGMDCFVDRTNNSVFFGSYVYGQYYKSTNGGATITNINSGLPYNTGNEEWLCAWHQDPVTAATIYAGGRTDLYKTTNSGSSWSVVGTPSGTGNVIEFAIAPSNNQVIYAIKGNGSTYTVSKSTNGGVNFSGLAGLPTGTVAPTYIAVSNTDANVVYVVFSGYSASNKVFKSTNGGSSWTNLSSGLPNIPVNCIVYQNNSANQGIYIGTDVGVYYQDNATSWTAFNTGLPNVAVRDLEIYYGSNLLRAATYGRGTWESDLYSAPAAPTSNFSASQTSGICSGQVVTFTNTATGSPSSYLWYFPGGTPSTSTSANPTVTYANAGSYNVSLKVTNVTGSDSITKTNYVTINQTPSLTSTTPGSRCGTGTVNLGAAASTGTINWYNAQTSGTLLGSGTSFTTPSIGASTTYYASVTANSCSSSRTAVLATVVALPSVSMSVLDPTCVNYPAFTLSNGTPTGGTYSGNGVVGNQFNPNLAGTGNITITYTVTQNNCTNSTTTVQVVNACANLTTNQSSAIQVYPNPTEGKLTISGLFGGELFHLTLTDAIGRLVGKWETIADMSVNLDALANGRYHLIILSNNTQTSIAVDVFR